MLVGDLELNNISLSVWLFFQLNKKKWKMTDNNNYLSCKKENYRFSDEKAMQVLFDGFKLSRLEVFIQDLIKRKKNQVPEGYSIAYPYE